MARLTGDFLQRADDTIALYPQKRSAMLPLLHLVQEQNGHLTEAGMAHVGELLGVTSAEVLGTASFYDMYFTEPVGRHLVSVCTNIACLLQGGYELLEHAENRLGVRAGGTTSDGEFTLEEVECIALCGNAPCLTVNWRFFGDVTNESFDSLVDDLAAGVLAESVPPHGTLSRVRRTVGLLAGATSVAPVVEAPAPASDAPEAAVDTGHGVEPRDRAMVDRSAKQAEELEATGDTAPEPDSGERR